MSHEAPSAPNLDLPSLTSLPGLAINAAREIIDPAARAQHLSAAARFGGDGKQALFEEAAGAAMEIEDPARRSSTLLGIFERLARS